MLVSRTELAHSFIMHQRVPDLPLRFFHRVESPDGFQDWDGFRTQHGRADSVEVMRFGERDQLVFSVIVKTVSMWVDNGAAEIGFASDAGETAS